MNQPIPSLPQLRKTVPFTRDVPFYARTPFHEPLTPPSPHTVASRVILCVLLEVLECSGECSKSSLECMFSGTHAFHFAFQLLQTSRHCALLCRVQTLEARMLQLVRRTRIHTFG